jgi:hypothetical protein
LSRAFRNAAVYAAYDVFFLVEKRRLNDLTLVQAAIRQAHRQRPTDPFARSFETYIAYTKPKSR